MTMSLDRFFTALDAHVEARRSLEGLFGTHQIRHLWHHLTEPACSVAKDELAREGSLPVDRLHELFLSEIQRRPLVPLHELCAREVECAYRYDPAQYRADTFPCGKEGCFIDSSEIFQDTAVGDCGRLVELRCFPDCQWVLADVAELPCP